MAKKKSSSRKPPVLAPKLVAEPAKDPSELLTEALAAIERRGSFAVQGELPTSALSLRVEGVGPISLPVSQAKARALCEVATPARHGFKDQTRLDKAVRDTWEISRARLAPDLRRWEQALAPELARIRDELGLDESRALHAELHNLLVYAPGQFFAPHQDTEKGEGMIGTLVVTLPSTFTGGAMVVEHHDEKVVFRGQGRKLGFLAFYADCHHEVQPVKSGYRVVLTFNLLLSKGKASSNPLPSRKLDALEARVRDFFQTPPAPRWRGAAPEGPPDRLVYLLDHQYSQRGLGWSQLKNGDAARVAALGEVARRLDCELALALADVHESWSCADDDVDYWRWGRGRSDDSRGKARELPQRLELHDSEVELRHFVDGKGKPGTASGYAASSEICFTKPSVDLSPFESRHEGYMGNWGNTVDHWYHRAAVVLWPRERTFVIRAKLSAKYALDELSRSVAREGAEAARVKASQLVPFWASTWHSAKDSRLVLSTLRVALTLDSAELARALLRPLRATHLNASNAPATLALAERYGWDWLAKVLDEWHTASRHWLEKENRAWLPELPALIGALMGSESAAAVSLARRLVSDAWAWMAEEQRSALLGHPSAVRDHTRGLERPLLGLMDGAMLSGNAEVQRAIEELLKSADYPLLSLCHLLVTARKGGPSRRHLDSLEAHCVGKLKQQLARPPRSADDWSIEPRRRCACARCAELLRFLRARDQLRKEWPLAAEGRDHIHRMLERDELPVTESVKQTGRPFTLVLTKSRALFAREAAERLALQKALDSLSPVSPSRSPQRAARPAPPRRLKRGAGAPRAAR